MTGVHFGSDGCGENSANWCKTLQFHGCYGKLILLKMFFFGLRLSPKRKCVCGVCVSDAPSTEQQELFLQKLHQCCVLFDFIDSVTDLKSKEVKRATLNELVEYVSTSRGILVDSAYSDIIYMVRTLL